MVAALRERDLVGRAMVSTMELLHAETDRGAGPEPAARLDLSESDQGLDLQALGEAGRCWPPWWRCATACRASPREKLPQIGVEAMWVYHPLVTSRLARICKLAGVELIAWTVDDAARMRKLVDGRRHRPLLQRPAPLLAPLVATRPRPLA